MPGQSGLPPYRTKAPIHRPHHVSPAAPESQGTEPDRRLSPGAERPPYRRRGHLCISGQTGLGQVPPARIVESGLRGIYGRPGPQRAQGRATVAPRHGTSGSIETQGSSSRSSGNPKTYGDPTTIGEPPRSRSAGFLMMSVATLMSVAAFLWHPVPPLEPTFSTSPWQSSHNLRNL